MVLAAIGSLNPNPGVRRGKRDSRAVGTERCAACTGRVGARGLWDARDLEAL